jgi:curved DNA-binding protein CbpA
MLRNSAGILCSDDFAIFGEERCSDALPDIAMNDASDAYATLGVPRTASASEIKRAFGTLSRHVHPDKSDNKEIAESAFREVRSAYDVLSDPMQRHIYDEHGSYFTTDYIIL